MYQKYLAHCLTVNNKKVKPFLTAQLLLRALDFLSDFIQSSQEHYIVADLLQEMMLSPFLHFLKKGTYILHFIFYY